MAFVQIIEYQSSKIEEIQLLIEKFRANSPADSQSTHATVTKDRDKPNTYVTIVEFDSYDKAMANSSRPETAEMAQAMAALCDGPPTFRNLDVLETM